MQRYKDLIQEEIYESEKQLEKLYIEVVNRGMSISQDDVRDEMLYEAGYRRGLGDAIEIFNKCMEADDE